MSGAPKFEMMGKLIVFQFENSFEKLKIEDSKIGKQYGEYFGASLISADINNDKLDDIIVGAPFYKSSQYDEGRIYIFLGSTVIII